MGSLATPELIETVNGFDVFFTPLEDHGNPTEDMEYQDAKNIHKQLKSGELIHFCAMVTVEKCGIKLSTQYLGSCIYECHSDFHTKYKTGYFDQMKNEAISEAKETIKQLSA